MTELLQQALLPANLPYSLLLLLVMLYWVTVFVGVLDLDFLDFDLDADAEIDVDTDIDVDADAEGAFSGGFLANTLAFFHVGAVPFMIFFSILVLSLWTFSLIGNHYFGEKFAWFAMALIIPNLLFSLAVTKLLTWPFKGSYQRMNRQGISKRELVGKMCRITTAVSPGTIGQAELTYDEQNFLLKIRSQEESIAKGEQALLIEYDPEKDFFLVTPFRV
jgi:RNase P/RNase MRP subunit p29